MDNRPIGVFDSGIGGLTVLKELIKQLPDEDFIYFGDTARVPYGPRPKETIIKYTLKALEFLASKDTKAIVIACNTATAIALEEAKKQFDLPLIGVIEPGSKAAIKLTRNKKIGVIATVGTINSSEYQNRIQKDLPEAKVIGKACSLFVPIVEEGWEDTDVAELTAQKYLSELKEQDIDTLVLGCTHYPVLREQISKVIGDNVVLVNPAYESAKATKEVLMEKNILSGKKDGGTCTYYSSGEPEKFKEIGENIVKYKIDKVEKIVLDE